MGNTFKPFSFYGEIDSDTLEKYHTRHYAKQRKFTEK